MLYGGGDRDEPVDTVEGLCVVSPIKSDCMGGVGGLGVSIVR